MDGHLSSVESSLWEQGKAETRQAEVYAARVAAQAGLPFVDPSVRSSRRSPAPTPRALHLSSDRHGPPRAGRSLRRKGRWKTCLEGSGRVWR
jgi:hypothetical protein